AAAPLKPGTELLLGRTRVRFEAPPPPAPGAESQTVNLATLTPAELHPALVRLTPAGDGPRAVLDGGECWVGRDPACALALADDPLVSPRHARVRRDAKGRWVVSECEGPSNGVWVRLPEVRVTKFCVFQLGEQRF